MSEKDLQELVSRYRRDPELAYNTWFVESPARPTVPELPPLGLPNEVAQTVALIDVIWINQDSGEVVCAFEVEKSTAIYSGMLRLLDLAKYLAGRTFHFVLVAPDDREKEIQTQLRRPSFAESDNLEFCHILFSELCEHCSGLCKFGGDYRIMLKVSNGKYPL